MSEMTPREIVSELDKHIIGQDNAKRSVAIVKNRTTDKIFSSRKNLSLGKPCMNHKVLSHMEKVL